MFDGLGLLATGIAHFLTPISLFNIVWATLLGIVIGALPGLTATMGVALLVTLTYKMAPDQAILCLMCIYSGAIYGGSRTAILLAIPGTPASAATSMASSSSRWVSEVSISACTASRRRPST